MKTKKGKFGQKTAALLLAASLAFQVPLTAFAAQDTEVLPEQSQAQDEFRVETPETATEPEQNLEETIEIMQPEALEPQEEDMILVDEQLPLYQDGAFPLTVQSEAPAALSATSGVTMTAADLAASTGDVAGAKALILERTKSDFMNGNFYYLKRADGTVVKTSEIDIYDYNISMPSAEAMARDVINENPALFYCSGAVSVKYYPPEYRAVKVYIVYNETYTVDDVTRYEQAVQAALDKTIESGMSDFQKVLAVHEFIATRASYDTSYTQSVNYDAYSALVLGRAVSQGYTLVGRDLLNRIGISSCYAENEEMGHIWNAVLVNGAWYNVDVSWDDTYIDLLGRVNHTYFLKSNSYMIQQDARFETTVCDAECYSTTYDSGAYWQYKTGIVYENGNNSYSMDTIGTGADQQVCLVYRALDTGAATVLSQASGVWNTTNGYREGNYSRMWRNAGYFYYSTQNAIYRYDPANATTMQVYAHTDASTQIYGMQVEGNIATIDLRTASEGPEGTGTQVQVELKEVVKNGLVQDEDGVWRLYKDGKVETDYTGPVLYNGDWYYVAAGVLNFDYTGLAIYDGTWYYFAGSKADFGYTGLAAGPDGNWYYIINGVLVWGCTGLVQSSDGNWYFIDNSTVDFSYTGLALHDDVWYYVNSGAVDFGFTGLVGYGEDTYYVESGKLNFDYTGFVQGTDGNWYYCASSVVQKNLTSLVQYGDAWYYVKNGMIDFSYTGLVPYGETLYYVGGGILDWSFNGTVTYEGRTYQVVNGVAHAV